MIAAATPVTVELYYESLCPGCRSFITTSLKHAWKTLKTTGKKENVDLFSSYMYFTMAIFCTFRLEIIVTLPIFFTKIGRYLQGLVQD